MSKQPTEQNPPKQQPTYIKDMHGNMIRFGDKVRFSDKVEWYGIEYKTPVLQGRMTKQDALKEIAKKPYEVRTVESVQDYEWLLSTEVQEYWEICS